VGDPALLERAADRLASRILGSGRAATTRHFASIEAAPRLTEESR
jgi:hypothetical protein